MEPVYLQHKDAKRQAGLYAVFTAITLGLLVAAFAVPLPGKWFILALVPVGLFLGYSTLRLATLRVRLDEAGLWEPNPFRLTYVTPWNDISRVRKTSHAGAMKTRFIGIEIVHKDGGTHEITALQMQGGAVYAEPMVEEWIAAIVAAKRQGAT